MAVLPLVTLERQHPAAMREPGGPAAFLPRSCWPAERSGPPALPDAELADDAPSTAAYVNHGRWLADCPACGRAQLQSYDDHRLYCPACDNGGSGSWARVVWPANAAALEAVLLQRPVPDTRNWTPGETLEALRVENEAHGCDAGPADPARLQAALGLRPAKD